MDRVLLFFKRYGLILLWAAFILAACGLHPTTLTQLHLSDLFSYDKPIHAILFGVQAWLIIYSEKKAGYKGSFKKLVIAACVISASYGALIEVLQLFWFEGRSYDYFDMIADGMGAGIVGAWQVGKIRNTALRAQRKK